MNAVMRAYEAHQEAAREALRLFRAMCDYPVPRVPGCDTVIRLAWRIECGASIQAAAERELVYRLNLAADRWRVFGSPCLWGQ